MCIRDSVCTSVAKADEMHDLTGVERSALVAFRPSRLALHEVLIRVTADLSVPDGSKIEDLGINFRRMTRAILARCVDPRIDEITAVYESLRKQVATLIDGELLTVLTVDAAARAAATAPPARGLRTLLEGWRARPSVAAREVFTEAETVA